MASPSMSPDKKALGAETPSNSKPIKRRSKACKRCLKRRQRCHGFPVCSACEEANQPCEQSAYAVQLHSHDSSHASFKRIQALEAQLASAVQEISALREGQRLQPSPGLPQPPPLPFTTELAMHQSGHPADPYPQQVQMPWFFNEASSSTGSHGGPDHSGNPDGSMMQTPGSAMATLGFDAACLMRNPEINLGMTPVLTASPHDGGIEHMAQTANWAKAMPYDTASTPAKYSDYQERAVPVPDDATGRRMIDVYLDKIHPRWPFLSPSDIYALHAQQYESNQATPMGAYDIFKLYIIYAIGATFIKLVDPHSEPLADGFFAIALQHSYTISQSHSLQSVEGMALFVLYSLRAANNTGIWYMVGLAMRTCIDLGLHQESTYTTGSLAHNRMKRRLFWCVYLEERIISVSLRRPYSIADQDIDTRLPPETEEPLKSEDGDMNGSINVPKPKSSTQFTMWVKLIQIKRFESCIQCDVYHPSESLQQRFAKMKPLLASLDAWNTSMPPLTETEHEYLQLQWNKAVGQCLRPFLSMMQKDSPLIARCLDSSSQVCDVFKRMHQQDSYGHSFVSAHTIFIAGVTICYCLFLAPHLFGNRSANALRSCSSTMFVIAERFPGLRKHRDVLDDIIDRIMDSSMGSGHQQKSFKDPQNPKQPSRHDYMAVQSLLNLSAQQEPQEISDLGTPTQPAV